MNNYTFRDDSFYCGNGCDCCDPMLIECYNDIDNVIGHTCHSIEDCIISVLIHEDILTEYDHDFEIDQLMDLLKYNKISVNFI